MASSLAAVINPTGDLIFAPIEGALVAAHFEARSRLPSTRQRPPPRPCSPGLKGKTHWHFATHGTFDLEEARRSALAMKGGVPLSVGTLLETDGLGHPRLVVLSACETGLHDIDRMPEEFIGLPGAFMTIGARAVLGTLWPVDDRAAARSSRRASTTCTWMRDLRPLRHCGKPSCGWPPPRAKSSASMRAPPRPKAV